MNKLLVIVIIAVVVITAGVVTGILINSAPKVQQAVPQTAKTEAPPASIEATEEIHNESKSSSIEPLREQLSNKIGSLKGEWAVYVSDLNTGDSIEIGNRRMVAASLIKLFIMAKVYTEIEAGNIQETAEINKKLRQMITISHNEASNDLVAIIGGGDFKKGMKLVNEYAVGIKCTDTEQQRDMKDYRPVPIPEQNYTSVNDCGKLLAMIYKKQCVSQRSDEKMIELLLAQTRRGKIPEGLPGSVKCANKTGELSDVENDAAIVFSSEGDYVLCVMSNEVNNTGDARSSIVQISKDVYSYFNR